MNKSPLITLRSLAEQQRYPQLKSSCMELLAADDAPDVLPLLALAQLHLGERTAAQSNLQLAQQQLARLDIDAKVDLAAVYLVLQQPETALTLLDPLLAEQPDHAMALARRGLAQMMLGSAEAAVCDFERGAELSPQRLAIWINLAQLRLQLQQPDAAERALQQGVSVLQQRAATLPAAEVVNHQRRLDGLQLQCWVLQQAFSAAEAWLNQQHTADESLWLEWLGRYAAALAEQDHHAQAEEVLREGLKSQPDSVPLLMQLAELAQLQGHFMQALSLLQRAIKHDESNPLLWTRLSAAALHRFEQRARKAAEKAVELVADLKESADSPPAKIAALRLQAKHALAQVESQEQHFELAEQLFREILAENDHFLPALQGLGQMLMQQGEIEEAVQLFERVKAMDPVKGYSALINARQFPEDEATLERMERSARLPSLEGRVSAGILFQLASAWEKRKSYAKAMDLVDEANRISRRFLPYSAKAHRNQCARIRHAFCKALYDYRQECGYRGDHASLPIYVLGMPRSGTTLVEQIIAGHSQIFGAGELGIIPSRIQGLNRWERHTGSGRHYPDCIDDLNPPVVTGIAEGIIKELQEYAPEAKHVVDKLPHNFENIGLIKFLFPKAKIISVRRDPRDIAISNYFTDYQAKHGGMGFAYDLGDIGQQLADHNLLMHHWHQLFPGEILDINYEDVVSDLEGSARKMLDYIGVAWEPQVLAFNELDRPVKTASVWQVRQPIYTTSTAKWRRYEAALAPLLAGTNAPISWEPFTMITLPEPGLLTDGVALFKEGKLDEAEYSFKKMLHHNPEHAAAHYMVGLIYLNKHHLQEGIELIEQALERCPWQREWRNTLLKAYEVTGQTEKRAALQAKGEQPPLAQGLDDAAAAKSTFAYTATGTFAELPPSSQSLSEPAPVAAAEPPPLSLAQDLYRSGDIAKALAITTAILKQQTDDFDALHLHGVLCSALGRFDEALALFQRALAINANYPQLYNNQGNAFAQSGRSGEAITSYRLALTLKPDYAEAHNNLGNALIADGDLEAAIASFQQALALKPDYAEALNNLGSVLKDCGRIDGAIDSLQQALALRPDYALAHSNLLFTLHYHPRSTPEQPFAAHQGWQRQQAGTIVPARLPPPTASDKRPLKIALLSGGFRSHPALWLSLAAFEHLDRNRFALHAYAYGGQSDGMTARLRKVCRGWCDISGLKDADVAQQIRDDGID
ncbi:MAG: tetratricopeptide repeat protein, partial [Gammaproteobacteria bacterium]|nr:tetratricopeptide repeat protein [Gammaproteobacteria bacterium]